MKGKATVPSEQWTVPLFYSDNAHRPRHQEKAVCLRHRDNVALASARHVLDVELHNLFMPGRDHFISADRRIFYPSITARGTDNDSSIGIAFIRKGPWRREYHVGFVPLKLTEFMTIRISQPAAQTRDYGTPKAITGDITPHIRWTMTFS